MQNAPILPKITACLNSPIVHVSRDQLLSQVRTHAGSYFIVLARDQSGCFLFANQLANSDCSKFEITKLSKRASVTFPRHCQSQLINS